MPGWFRSEPPGDRSDTEAASGRPFGAGGTTYGAAALRLLDNGYEPLPIIPGEKRPAVRNWSDVAIGAAEVEAWAKPYHHCGIGLRTGALVGIDIDVLDPDEAHLVAEITCRRLGDTLTRVGYWPKRLLLYRTERPFAKLSIGAVGRKLEVLGRGQQLVAFGRHPDTGRDYYWPHGDTPLDTPLDGLPLIDEAACRALCVELAPLLGSAQQRGRRRSRPAGGDGVTRDEQGRVSDGRDSWLSTIAFHTVHDALDDGRPLDAGALTELAWQRFAASTDLDRPRKDGAHGYTREDAGRKIADKLRLLADGRLPPRASCEPEYAEPPHPADTARAVLDTAIAQACGDIEAWYRHGLADAPQIGLRATVGLGKSQIARQHLLALQARLRGAGLPHRVLVLTPSHELADETAAAWTDAGADVAVLRGYLARDPIARAPMCADPEAVEAAMTAGTDIHGTACLRGADRCAHFEGCRKQANRRAVEVAEVVVAAYDVLFSGLAVDAASIGVILIDEGCWARAARSTACIWDDAFPGGIMGKARSRAGQQRATAATADLLELRRRLSGALTRAGVLDSDRVRAVGIAEADCRVAAELEQRGLRQTGLFPGMDREARKAALIVARENEALRARAAVWRTLAEQLRTGRQGRIRIIAAGELRVHDVKPVHVTLQGKPVLHLDATLRLDLARTVLPRLTVQEIDAAAPHMAVTLVSGSFGKGTLCRGAADPQEQQRRTNRRRECVDYVRWQARRFPSGQLLVVTYQDIEADFAGIPGVEVAHFNAVAGLDCYGDVAALIVIGRPLPRDSDLVPLVAAYFGEDAGGNYSPVAAGVRMRDGGGRSVPAIRHSDATAEVLRAAICDDELVQAIGRGRGVNRTAGDPLEVHVLADVALPLVHDRVVPWEMVKPDLFQRMLLAGIAVDSPCDAALLHPAIFAGVEQAKSAFRRAFGGHFPISSLHREMTLKSAAYRRSGRGRSWQRAWWLDGDADAVRRALETVLGALADWKLDQVD